MELGKKLLSAAKDGDTEEVRLLMSRGAPFTTDWLGTSPLHLTAKYDRLETSEVLLRAGCSRDARTKVEKTPLHVAAQEGHPDVCELLLLHGADVDARDMVSQIKIIFYSQILFCLPVEDDPAALGCGARLLRNC